MWYKIKSAVTGWFGDVKIYKYPFFIIAGHVAYKIKGEHQREILSVLKPGDVLLRRYDHYISGLMIPGYFTHAALYVGDDQVIHVTGIGINKEDILTFLRCDNIKVLRCKDETKIQPAIDHAWAQLDKEIKYDYDFNMESPDKFYCSEFVDFSFGYPVRDDIVYEGEGIKGGYVLPDDFLVSEAFEIVWHKD